jgi:hypothetical protein
VIGGDSDHPRKHGMVRKPKRARGPGPSMPAEVKGAVAERLGKVSCGPTAMTSNGPIDKGGEICRISVWMRR